MTSVALHAIFFLSGVAGLGYQTIWARMFAVGLGHEYPSLLATLAGFFAGFGLGAALSDARLGRTRFPGRWYAGLETVIGAWALVSIPLIPWATDALAETLGPSPSLAAHWLVAFAIPFACLLPASAAMGATLPVMDRFLALDPTRQKNVAGLYAVHTAGATLGVIAAVFYTMPQFGNSASMAMLAAANFACAVGTLVVSERSAPLSSPQGTAQLHDTTGGLSPAEATTLFATGLLGIGFEVLCVRVGTQALANTIYTYAIMLAVYLFGSAAGATLIRRAGRASRMPVTGQLLVSNSVACSAGVLVLGQLDWFNRISVHWISAGGHRTWLAEAGLAGAALFVPSVSMGATFTALAQRARKPDRGLGAAVGWNAVGAALAPSVFGVWAVPLAGLKPTIAAISLGYLLLVRGWTRRLAIGSVLAIGLLVLAPRDLSFVEPLPGGQVLAMVPGVQATVAVVTDQEGNRYLKVDDQFVMGGTAGLKAEPRQAHLPLLLHPAPERALFLGVGTGVTLAAGAAHTKAEGVEIVPEILTVLPYFRPWNQPADGKEPAMIITADARRFVRATTRRYDVIVADLVHPAHDGAGSLYTREHFSAIRARLRRGGLFCQWLPLHQLDPAILRSIVATFLSVFPDQAFAIIVDDTIYSPALGLIGMDARPAYQAGWFERRVQDPTLRKQLADVGLVDDYSLFGAIVADRDQLVRYASVAPLVSDDRSIVSFAAPHVRGPEDVPSYSHLMSLILLFEAEPEGDPIVAKALPLRPAELDLRAYARARNEYLRALVSLDEGNWTAYLEGLLRSTASSAHFQQAYLETKWLAAAFASQDPRVSAELERRLDAARSAALEGARRRAESL